MLQTEVRVLDNVSFSNEFYFTKFIRESNYHTNNSAGVVTHFFGYMLKGYSRFVAEGNVFQVNEGELVYIPKGASYHSYWFGDPQVEFISLGFGFFPDCTKKSYHLQKICPSEEEKTLIESIPLENPVDCKSVGLLYFLLDRLLPNMTYESKKPANILFETACSFLKSDTKISVKEVAKRCGVSESGLYSIFRAEGTTPVDFRQKFLCDRAVSLLIATDMTVENIADRLGFSTPAYFRRVLKKQFGKTPKEIRRDMPV
jgi:AraC-like DNA-binding protein